jgi:hypothetical protein
MSKVVYLLGAGASYGIRHKEAPAGTKSLIVEGLPIVKEINDELNVVIDWLKVERETDKTTIVEFLDKKSSVEELKPSLIEDFNWLKENCAKHATIDTFARKLHIRCEAQSYSRLKFLLSTFFLIEQVIHPYDKRYDTFFANIVNRNGEIPDNILIMTWNYDIQLDIAYDEYQNGRLKTYVAGDPLNSSPNAKVFKINGSANYYGNSHIESRTLMEDKETGIIRRIFNQYNILAEHGYTSDGSLEMHFAWDEAGFDEMSTPLFKKLSDAEVLIVIGYTFPFFNRQIDRQLFENMGSLRKVYIQDPNAKGIMDFLPSVLTEEQNNSLMPNVKPISNTSSFFLPPEL